jgi:hypothetical protein
MGGKLVILLFSFPSLKQTNNNLQQTVGSCLIFYTLCFQNFEKMWQILFVNAFFAFIAQFISNIVYAQECASLDPAWMPHLLFVNELNWCIAEIAILYYSYIKTSVVIKNTSTKYMLTTCMNILFALDFVARIYVGSVKFQEGKDYNDNVLAAQMPAFGIVGFADCIILGLLIVSYTEEFRKNKESSFSVVSKTLLQSSLPRITLIIVVNRACK